MRTAMRILKSTMVISVMAASSALFLSSCHKDNDNDNLRTYSISGTASGNQMVPIVTGSGSGTISGNYDPNTHVLTYTTTWTNLTGAPTSAGFYIGATGVAGAAVGDPWNLGAGLSGTGSFSSSMTLTSEQDSQLTGGSWYYLYGTVANPNGEIRGQIIATQQ
jgi:hypothetical protein